MVGYTQQMLGWGGIPGGYEWIVILIVALLIFGKRLPDVARSVGRSMTEFKKGINEAKESTDDVAGDVRKMGSEVVDDAKKASGMGDNDES